MLEVEPPLPFPINPHIFVFGLDQCNQWQAAKDSRKGEYRGAERLDGRGMPVKIRSETLVNTVQRHIPFTLGMLTPEEVKLISERGPYTEDYSNVLTPLEPVTVQRQLWDGMHEMIALVEQPFAKLAPTQIEISESLLGRIRNPFGKTPLDILPSIPNCDTKAFKDVFKFVPFMLMRCLASMIVMIVHSDGQTVEILRASKRRWPEEYKFVLIAQGYFHAFYHFMAAIQEGFWPCILCTFATWLHKDKQVYEKMKDLQHDNAKHLLDFHRASVAAILCYLRLHVKNPPYQVFVDDPQLYYTLVENQGGIVMRMYLLHGGSPILRYQRGIRQGSGRICKEMMAYIACTSSGVFATS